MVLCVPIVKSRRSNKTRLLYSHLYGVCHHHSRRACCLLSFTRHYPYIVLTFLRVIDIRYNLVKSTFNPFLFPRVHSLPSPHAIDCCHRTRLTDLLSFYFPFLFSSVFFLFMRIHELVYRIICTICNKCH